MPNADPAGTTQGAARANATVVRIPGWARQSSCRGVNDHGMAWRALRRAAIIISSVVVAVVDVVVVTSWSQGQNYASIWMMRSGAGGRQRHLGLVFVYFVPRFSLGNRCTMESILI